MRAFLRHVVALSAVLAAAVAYGADAEKNLIAGGGFESAEREAFLALDSRARRAKRFSR